MIFNQIDKLPDKGTKINSIPSTLAMMIFLFANCHTQNAARPTRIEDL